MRPQKRKTLKIRSKLTIIIALLTAVMLAVIWLLFVVFLDDFYRQAKYREITVSARTVEAALDSDADTLSDTIESVCGKTGASILVRRYTEAGAESIGFVMPRGILSSTYTVSAIIESTVKDGGQMIYTFDSSGTKYGKSSGGDSLLYSKVIDTDGSRAAILINVQLTPVDATRTTITGLLIIVSAVFIIIAVVVGHIISSTLSAPLTRLNTSAKRIGTPEYRRLEGDPGCRETAELNETLSKASDEMQKVEGLRRELIANVSHDLRTPLTMISGYGEMMRDIPGENNAENIQIIIDEADRLNRLVNDLLSLSKLENGADALSITEFNITKMLKELVQRYSTMRAVQGYDLRLCCDEEYTVKGDEVKLTQVFYNLINNAINYTGQSKLVKILQSKTKIDGKNFIRFDVIDDGDGILPENIPYIWDRYYKENRAHKRADIGTGLGLSIVKKIVEEHNGYYGVISELGHGSDFYFCLPSLN